MIVGASNAGKSTLAVALSEKLGLPAVHIDQLHHQPGTNFHPRPKDEFIALHENAVSSDAWIMEGNYTGLVARRLERATGVILISSSRWLRLIRYFKRVLAGPKHRLGAVEGSKEQINGEMIQLILFKPPDKARQYAKRMRETGLPYLECRSARELEAIYEAWGLSRN